MAFLLADSFDFYDIISDLNKRGLGYVASPDIETTIVKNGRASIRFITNEQVTYTYLTTSFTGSLFVSFWWYRSAVLTDNVLCLFKTSSTGQYYFKLFLEDSGQIHWSTYTDAQLGSSSIKSLTLNTWHHFEIKGTSTDSCSTGDCVVKIDGEIWLDLIAGEDTNYGASAGIIHSFTYNGHGTYTYLDSLVIWDDTGSGTWSDFIGMLNIETIMPDSNGTTSDFSGSDGNSVDNYLLVDEEPNDGDTTYVESDNISDVDLFNYEALTGTISSVAGVQVVSTVKKDVPGTREFKALTRISSTNYQGDTLIPSDAEYQFLTSMWELNPDTAVAWTESDVNAAEFGIEITA